MASRVAAFDWAGTPLGPLAEWPSSLRRAVETALGAVSPMVVVWGPDQTQVYNDACIPIYGRKHPLALGVSARETWAEIREPLGPLVDQVLRAGEPAWKVGLALPVERSGDFEEACFTVSFGPLRDDSGRVAGFLANAIETTTRTGDEGRIRVLSHELRSPLNTMAVVIELLGHPSLPEEYRREQIEKLRRQVRRMSDLLEEALDATVLERDARERPSEQG